MKTIWRIYWLTLRCCFLTILLSLIIKTLTAVLSPIGLQIYEKQAQSIEHGALGQLCLFLIFMVATNLATTVLSGISGINAQKIKLEIIKAMGKPIFKYSQSISLYEMDNPRFVAEKKRAFNAVDSSIPLIVENVNGIIAAVISISILSLTIASYNIGALIILVIMVLIQNVFTKKGIAEGVLLNKEVELSRIKESYYNGLFLNKYASKEVRQWMLGKYIENNRYKLNENIKRKYINLENRWTAINLKWASLMYLLELSYYILLLIRYADNKLTLGMLLYLVQVLTTYLGNFTQLIKMIKEVASVCYEIDTYFKFVDSSANKDVSHIPHKITRETNEVTLRNVSYSCNGRQILRDISFTIKPGEKVLIAGKNGCGKSTLLNIILGFLTPTQGMVDIGNGKAVLMAQDSCKFLISIRENIVFSDKDIKDSIIIDELKKLSAMSLTEKSPLKLNTHIGPAYYVDGIDLSGGETQKMAATRALMSESSILIFDEPVSALDSLSEKAFFETISESNYKSKTMVFVSHRLRFVDKMDYILFLDDGRLIAKGSHQDLLVRCPMYRNYYMSWLMAAPDEKYGKN